MSHRAFVAEITARAEMWLRRCNGQPTTGIPVSSKNLCEALIANVDVDVKLDSAGRITWRVPGNKTRLFTAEPVPAEPPEAPA